MMATRISKAYRGSEHIGWKKTVGGREWFLGYGIAGASEVKAIALAELLEAKWKLAKASGNAELSQTDFDDAKGLIEGRPRCPRVPALTASLIDKECTGPLF